MCVCVNEHFISAVRNVNDPTPLCERENAIVDSAVGESPSRRGAEEVILDALSPHWRHGSKRVLLPHLCCIFPCPASVIKSRQTLLASGVCDRDKKEQLNIEGVRETVD